MIDDNPADLRIMEEGFVACGLAANLTLTENAIRAYAFLAKRGPFLGVPTPDLILLDLAMPIISGYQCLETIKKDSVWRKIPLFVLSSSQRPEDARRCYGLGANLYLIKPLIMDHYIKLAQRLGEFLWEGRPVETTSAIHVVQSGPTINT
jgi:CheY-like chemotaxis protein